LDVIKTADWVIDLGPGGGDAGGEIVAVGTPEALAADAASVTGQHLARRLPGTRTERPRARRAAVEPPAGERRRVAGGAPPGDDGSARTATIAPEAGVPEIRGAAGRGR